MPELAERDVQLKIMQVLGPEASQEDVYEAAVRPIVEDVMRGYNGTIMAYGQASYYFHCSQQ